MRKLNRKCLLLLGVICSFTAYSQNIDYAHEVVKTLSSVEFAGRGYSSQGVEKAADYIIREFKKNGLHSLNGEYCQSFNINANTFPGNMELKIDEEKFIAGEDFIVDPSSPSLKGNYEAIIIKVEDLLDTKRFKKIVKAAENKVLIVDQRGYQTSDDSEKKLINEISGFLKYNPELKHVALIELTGNKLTWHIAPEQRTRPVFILNSGIEIKSKAMVTINLDAELKTNYPTCNIAGYQQGKSIPDSLVVLTAHYDHLGQLGETAYIPGANDNASGIAMLLAIARHFQNNPPDYSILYVATSAEELGLLGARHFVENPPIELGRIKFLINFDLAGTGDEGIKVVNGSVYRSEFDRLTEINNSKKYLPAVKIRGEACISDHCMFYMKKVPCFYIYTLGGISAYHDINDKYETLPFTVFEDYSKLMIEFIEGMAN